MEKHKGVDHISREHNDKKYTCYFYGVPLPIHDTADSMEMTETLANDFKLI